MPWTIRQRVALDELAVAFEHLGADKRVVSLKPNRFERAGAEGQLDSLATCLSQVGVARPELVEVDIELEAIALPRPDLSPDFLSLFETEAGERRGDLGKIDISKHDLIAVLVVEHDTLRPKTPIEKTLTQPGIECPTALGQKIRFPWTRKFPRRTAPSWAL